VLRETTGRYRGGFDDQMDVLSLNNLQFLDEISLLTVAYVGPTRYAAFRVVILHKRLIRLLEGKWSQPLCPLGASG
jgi:hypothetical protein